MNGKKRDSHVDQPFFEPPFSLLLNCKIKGGWIRRIPDFLDAVDREILSAASTGARIRIPPEDIQLSITINKAIRENQLSIAEVGEQDEFFYSIDPVIELLYRSGQLDRFKSEASYLSESNLYAQQAMICFTNGPSIAWINNMFKKMSLKQQEVVKKLVKKGLSPTHKGFGEQLRDANLTHAIKTKVKNIIDKTHERYRDKEKVILNLMEKTAQEFAQNSTGADENPKQNTEK